MRIFTVTVLLLASLSGNAQKFSIKGQMVDTLQAPLPSATVMLLNPKDSSLVNFGVTNAAGSFEIKNVNKGTYQLKVSYVGFGTFTKIFATPETGAVVELGRMQLRPARTDLDEVVIQAEKNAVTVKMDTIEFNASSFKTKANANVEDLIKKMPGIEVETDGTIRAQGEQVQQVTVDGREFFGRDPKLATRNLPADAVEKVQVFDKKSDQSQFTGIDDGQKTKTINLELKEEKRNAAFGNMMAGYGTDNRYQGKANINRFNSGRQLSFLAMGNNINEQGFSFDEYMNFSGGASQMMGGGGGGNVSITIGGGGGGGGGAPVNFGGRQNGILTNYAGGVNFNRDFNKKRSTIGGNYFYSRLEQNIDKTTDRTTFLADNRSTSYLSNSLTLGESDSHKANLTVDHKIDSANSLKFTSALAYVESTQDVRSIDTTRLLINDNLVNARSSLSNSSSINKTINNTLLWRHKFNKKGRSMSSSLTFNLSDTDADGRTLTELNLQGSERPDVDQKNIQSTINQTLGTSVSYTEPLGNRRYLEANYNFRINKNDSDREVTGLDGGNMVVVDSLTNYFESDYTYHRPGLNLRVNRKKFNFTVGAGYQSSRLKGVGLRANQPYEIDRPFNFMLPSARFNYDFSSFKHLQMNYETSIIEPNINQLQPVKEATSLLSIYEGNPELKPAYMQILTLNYSMFDPAKFTNFFAMAMMNLQTDAIVSSVVTNENFVRTTKPVNVKNGLNTSLNLNYGFRIQKLKSRINLSSNISRNESIASLDNQESDVVATTIGGGARYNFTYKEILTLDLSANIRNATTDYEFEQQQDQHYINSTYGAEANISFLKVYQFNADFNYFVYDSRTNDFNQTLPMLNLWLSRFVLKGNAGEIKVGVSNLLDRSNAYTQTANLNYLQQERVNNLGRYFMVSFTYALNKQINPFGGGGRRGNRMMITM